MLNGLFIFLDDDFEDPLYADPDPADFDEDLWVALCESINDALEGDGDTEGVVSRGENHLGWRVLLKEGLAFAAAVTDDVKTSQVTRFLQQVSRRYLDEVDDVRNPDRDGVADIMIDVVPPWEDEED